MKETDAAFKVAMAQILGPDRTLWDFGTGVFTIPCMDASGNGWLNYCVSVIVDKVALKAMCVKIQSPDMPGRGKSPDWTTAILDALKRAAPLFDEKATPWKPGEMLPTTNPV